MRKIATRVSPPGAPHRVRLKIPWSRSSWIRAASLVCFGFLALFYAEPAHAVWEGASSGTSAYVPGNTYDFDATTNWVGGNIDYSFSGFTLTGNLVLNLDNAVATDAGGLNLDYAGNFDFTLTGITSSRTLTLNGDVSADTVAGGRTITLGGGAGVSLNLGTVNRNVTVGTGDTLVVANAIANTTGGITKNGAGVLQLNAANLYTGLTQVDAGELRWNIANALSSGDLTVNNGGTANISTFSRKDRRRQGTENA
jgi:autotransporter-associated beta strand protein